jgi:GNAT superfamily N-acetyltransferase
VGSQFSGTHPRPERRRLTGTFLHTSGRHLLLIRAEKESDISAVRSLNEAAFQRSAEADLVDALRRQARPIVSLVAGRETIVVGHILFSPVSLEGGSDLKIVGLAPMAVASQHQRTGIGSALVRAGLERCKKLGVLPSRFLVIPSTILASVFCLRRASTSGASTTWPKKHSWWWSLSRVRFAVGQVESSTIEHSARSNPRETNSAALAAREVSRKRFPAFQSPSRLH